MPDLLGMQALRRASLCASLEATTATRLRRNLQALLSKGLVASAFAPEVVLFPPVVPAPVRTRVVRQYGAGVLLALTAQVAVQLCYSVTPPEASAVKSTEAVGGPVAGPPSGHGFRCVRCAHDLEEVKVTAFFLAN